MALRRCELGIRGHRGFRCAVRGGQKAPYEELTAGVPAGACVPGAACTGTLLEDGQTVYMCGGDHKVGRESQPRLQRQGLSAALPLI
jgi:hypothetical protein